MRVTQNARHTIARICTPGSLSLFLASKPYVAHHDQLLCRIYIFIKRETKKNLLFYILCRSKLMMMTMTNRTVCIILLETSQVWSTSFFLFFFVHYC